MHKDFDKAAEAAAKNLKFTPAIHKKSKQTVSQVVSVEYQFKP
jgi:outer membrane biosynthesis protein TonB